MLPGNDEYGMLVVTLGAGVGVGTGFGVGLGAGAGFTPRFWQFAARCLLLHVAQ